jgi:biotin carboxylase
MSKKTLLIICGGIEATHGIALAQSMGYHVVVSDMDASAPGMKLADDFIVASTYDIEATLEAARAYNDTVRPLDGVMCIGADVPLTVAVVAENLGLPGISIHSAELAADKLAMKDRFKEAGVPIPFYAPVASPEDLKEIMQAHGPDMVIKPVDSRGSRGVIKLDASSDLEWAFKVAEENSPTKRVMVEAFLEGAQISTESIVLDGTCYTSGFSDRNYEDLALYAPYFIENGGNLPTHLDDKMHDDICDVVARAAAAMGITNGTVKGDIALSGGKPCVIELAARLSGGYFCTLIIPLNTGVDFVGNTIKLALGEAVNPLDLLPKYQQPMVQRYIFPAPGKITAIDGVEAARKLPGINEIVVSASVGDIVPPVSNTTARAAMILATGGSIDEAKANAGRAIDAINIVIEPPAQD